MTILSSEDQTPSRSRAICAAAFILTLILGYVSRKVPLFPAALGKYPGDALWSLMVYWLIAAIRPHLSITKVAAITFAISTAVEFLKLVSTPWFVAVRYSTLGSLIFGHVFTWNNLIAYAIGVAAGVIFEYLILWRRVRL